MVLPFCDANSHASLALKNPSKLWRCYCQSKQESSIRGSLEKCSQLHQLIMQVGRCSEPGASVMCGGRGITKDEELAESAVREKGSGWRLLKAGEAPSHCISPAILTGYRQGGYSMLTKFILTGCRPALTYIACLRSVLRIHNETVNIW